MDKAETKLAPKLTIQIWDNDKFSFDDYLGKKKKKKTLLRECVVFSVTLLFSVDIYEVFRPFKWSRLKEPSRFYCPVAWIHFILAGSISSFSDQFLEILSPG